MLLFANNCKQEICDRRYTATVNVSTTSTSGDHWRSKGWWADYPQDPMETSPITVVAVVVTRNPGTSFEDTLASLAAQDLASLPILVLDDGSLEPVTTRVAQVVPSAFVRRFENPLGFATVANESLSMVQGAEFLLFCHDDVALAPDAVRLLASEARRSGAAMVAPKIVAWNSHDRLLSLGSNLDRIGSPVALVEALELDQGQHDGVHEINHAPGAAVLVHAEKLRGAGGFDQGANSPTVLGTETELSVRDPLFGPDLGEDVDLSWRMKQLGHSISVQPMARVAHLGAAHGSVLNGGQAADPIAARQIALNREANRIRTMITTASGVRLPFVIIVLLLQSLIHVIAPGRRPSGSRLSPWRIVLRSVGSIRQQRKAVQAARVVSDRELLAAFQPLGARARASIRADVTTEGAIVWNTAERVVGGRSRLGRTVVAGFLAFSVLIVIGSRWLVRNGIPSVGQFAPWPSLRGLLGASFSEWRSSGLGVSAPAPPGTFLLAGTTALFFGKAALAQTVVTLGLFPVGALGMWRLANLLSSNQSARSVSDQSSPIPSTVEAVSVKPVSVETEVEASSNGVGSTHEAPPQGTTDESFSNGLSNGASPNETPATPATLDRAPDEAEDEPHGELSAKIMATAMYLLTPVFFDGLVSGRFDALVAYGLLPWILHRLLRKRATGGRSRLGTVLTDVVFLGVPLALTIAASPALLPVSIIVVAGWSAGSVLAGTASHGKMLMRRFLTAALGAAVLMAPWLVDMVLGSKSHLALVTGGDQAGTSTLRLADLFRMAAGPIGRSPSSWAFAVLAALPLFVADGARFRNAVRAWSMVIVTILVLWATGRGWIPVLIPNEHAMLVPVALGLALASGLGLAGVARDARTRSFGWRQWLGGAAIGGVFLVLVPVVTSVGSGRWNLPERTLTTDLRWLNDQAADGDFRVAWLGSPKVLPAASWRIGEDLAFTTSDDGLPSALGMYGARATPALSQVMGLLADARDRKTARLGASLAPFAFRYIVVLERPWEGGPISAIPQDFRAAMLDQLDLRQLEIAPGALLLENTKWVPTYAAVPARPEVVGDRVLIDLSGAQPVSLSSRSEAQLSNDASAAQADPKQALSDAEARRNDVVPGTELRGRIPPISTMTVSVAADDRWHANGATLDPSPIRLSSGTMAFAATGVRAIDGAPAIGANSNADVVSLAYDSPPLRRALRGVEGVLWLVCLLSLLRTRHRRRQSRESRLLAVERLDGSGSAAADFGESLGFGNGNPDDEESDSPGSFDQLSKGRLASIHGPVGETSRNAVIRRTVPGRTPGVILSTPSSTPTGAAETTPAATDDRRQIVDMDEGSSNGDPTIEPSTMADALWETWSRRREERDDKGR